MKMDMFLTMVINTKMIQRSTWIFHMWLFMHPSHKSLLRSLVSSASFNE